MFVGILYVWIVCININRECWRGRFSCIFKKGNGKVCGSTLVWKFGENSLENCFARAAAKTNWILLPYFLQGDNSVAMKGERNLLASRRLWRKESERRKRETQRAEKKNNTCYISLVKKIIDCLSMKATINREEWKQCLQASWQFAFSFDFVILKRFRFIGRRCFSAFSFLCFIVKWFMHEISLLCSLSSILSLSYS